MPVLRRLLLGTAAWSLVLTGAALPAQPPALSVTPYVVPASIPLSLMPAASQAAGHIHTSWPGFAKGHLPDNKHLVGVVGGQTFQFQQDSESHWISDPTVRAASVSAVIPVPLVAGQRLDIQVMPTAGAPNRTPWITPQAMVAAKDITLRSYGGNCAARVFVTSLRDIVTNLPRDTWGTNPAGGWDVPISGPVQVMIRAWRYWRDSTTGDYSKWRKDVMYVTARVDGTWEFIARSQQSNYDGPFAGGTVTRAGTAQGPLEYQPHYACAVEAYDGTTRIGAWGGPNDRRVLSLPVAAFRSNNVLTTLPLTYDAWTPVTFAPGPTSTLPSGLTVGTTYWLSYGSSGGLQLQVDADLVESNPTPIVFGTGGTGTVIVTPLVATFSGTGPVLAATDALPVAIGFTRSRVGVAWDKEYMSRGARMFPRYDQGFTRYSSVAEQIVAPDYYPNRRSWGAWLNTTGDNPGDNRIGYVNHNALQCLLNPFDAGFGQRARQEGLSWSDYAMWWDDPRSGRAIVGDNGPNDAGAAYPQMGPSQPGAAMNGNDVAWLGSRGNIPPLDRSGYRDGYSSATLDGSHMPAPWVVPAHMTGHPIFADQGVAHANAMFLYDKQRHQIVSGQTFYNVFCYDGQPRGCGWALRAVAAAETFTATARPEAAYLKHTLDTCAAFFATQATPGTQRLATGLLLPLDATKEFGTFYLARPYMINIWAICVGMEVLRGDRPGWRTYMRAQANFGVGILNDNNPAGGSAWLANNGYYVPTNYSDGSPILTLRQCINVSDVFGFAPGSPISFPATGFCIGNFQGTNNAFKTTSYGAVAKAYLAVAKTAGIVSLNGDDAGATYDLLNARMTTAPDAGVQWSSSGWTGAFQGPPRAFPAFAIVPG